jgi:acyl-CoA hydrolase
MSETLARPVAQSQVVMTELVLPTHTNSLGSIFGGVVMSWIDICGAISALRHAKCEVVTASIDDLHFIAPVYKGWVVNLKSSVNFVSRTSMEVGVRVDAENPKTGELFHTASAYLTFVGIGSDGRPRKIPEGLAVSDDEKRRWLDALKRREFRLKRRAK